MPALAQKVMYAVSARLLTFSLRPSVLLDLFAISEPPLRTSSRFLVEPGLLVPRELECLKLRGSYAMRGIIVPRVVFQNELSDALSEQLLRAMLRAFWNVLKIKPAQVLVSFAESMLL
jgi:hypothetical protein